MSMSGTPSSNILSFQYPQWREETRSVDTFAYAYLKSLELLYTADAPTAVRTSFNQEFPLISKLSDFNWASHIPPVLWNNFNFCVKAMGFKIPGLMDKVRSLFELKLAQMKVSYTFVELTAWLKHCQINQKICFDHRAAFDFASRYKAQRPDWGLKLELSTPLWLNYAITINLFKNRFLKPFSDTHPSHFEEFNIAWKACAQFKGWRSISSILPLEFNWVTFLSKDQSTFLRESDFKGKSCPVGLSGINPYKKGFDLSEYEYLCELLEVIPFSYKADKSNGAFQASIARMVLLLGKDTGKIKQFVQQKLGIEEGLNLQCLHEAAQFKLDNRKSFSRESWMPILFKSNKAFQYIEYFCDFEEKFGVPDTIDEFLSKVSHFVLKIEDEKDYSLGKLLMEFGYCDLDYLEFKLLSISPKFFQKLPELDVAVPGTDYCIKSTNIGDPRSLVAGHLSGCCQSIFDEGHSCALISYGSPYYEVYWIEHKKTKKILGQMLVWLAKDEHTLVVDSIESILRNDVNSQAIIAESIVLMTQRVQSLGFELCIGNHNHGITKEVMKRIKNKKMVSAPPMREYCEYSDVGAYCWKLD